MDPMTDTFGEPIFTYTSQQAIDDGCLVHPFPDKFPGVLFTAAVHAAIEQHNDDRSYAQRAIPLIQDAILICRARMDEYLWTDGLEGNVTGKTVWIGKNDMGGITLMFPEDY